MDASCGNAQHADLIELHLYLRRLCDVSFQQCLMKAGRQPQGAKAAVASRALGFQFCQRLRTYHHPRRGRRKKATTSE